MICFIGIDGFHGEMVANVQEKGQIQELEGVVNRKGEFQLSLKIQHCLVPIPRKLNNS